MTRSMKLILLIGILLISNAYVLNIASADSHILPQIGDGEPTPENDGNITRAEYNSSVSFDTELHSNEASVFVTTNSTHLFIGFNISTSDFVAVNDTLPTVPEYELAYNNETHDWFAIVLDNNLDQDELGNENSPDDAIILDQYFTGGYDGYANGENVFQSDTNITYVNPDTLNETNLIGNNGTQNLISSRNITSTHVYYEVTKPLTEVDPNGFDFVLSELDILQFSIYQFTGSQANDTISTGTVDQTEWFSLRVNDTGNQPSLKAPGETTINIIQNTLDRDQLDAFATLADLYNMSIEFSGTFQNDTIDNFDLNIIVIDEDTVLLDNTVTRLRDYVYSGGNLMIFMAPGSSSANLAEEFELEFLSNTVLNGQVNDTESQLNIDSFTNQFTNEILTNRTFSDLTLYSSAFNITELLDEDNKLVLDQEYMFYDLFEAPVDAKYDENNNATIDEEENFNNGSLGVAFDFLKGGRLSMFPSLSLLEDGNITLSDNYLYLLNLLPWNAQFTNVLDIKSTNSSAYDISEGSTITVTVNMTDGFNNSASTAEVMVEVKRAGNVVDRVILTHSNGLFTGEIQLNFDGNLELEITGYEEGYGFAEGESLYLLVEVNVGSYNDLANLSPLVMALFVISVGLFALVYIRTKKY